MPTVTRQQLLSTLAFDGVRLSAFIDHNGNIVSGIVLSIEREDGSGMSFNVTMIDDITKARVTHYVRCDV